MHVECCISISTNNKTRRHFLSEALKWSEETLYSEREEQHYLIT